LCPRNSPHIDSAPSRVIDGLNAAGKNGVEFTTQVFKIHKSLGHEATDLVADIALRADLGGDVASKVAKVLGESSDEILAVLKQGDQFSAEAVEGLAKALTHGIDPETMKRVLAKADIWEDTYKQADLLKDLGMLTDRSPNLKGLGEHLIDILGQNNSGKVFEIRAAARLDDVFSEIGNEALDKLKIDLVGVNTAYQVKRSYQHLGGDTLNSIQSELGKGLAAARARGKGYAVVIRKGAAKPEFYDELVRWLGDDRRCIALIEDIEF
jgi:hypothetical protein